MRILDFHDLPPYMEIQLWGASAGNLQYIISKEVEDRRIFFRASSKWSSKLNEPAHFFSGVFSSFDSAAETCDKHLLGNIQ